MKRIIIAVLMLFTSSIPVSALDGMKKHVLLLNSYSKGYTWTDNIVKGVEDVLQDSSVILKVEYMDTKTCNTDDYFSLLEKLYETKYDNVKFDIIISSDDDAFDFIRKYRDRLFQGVPVVFCGVNNFTDSKVSDFNNFTGVNEASDFSTNLELILKLHPGTKRMFIINDKLTTAFFLKEEFMKASLPYREFIEFNYMEEMPLEKLTERVTNLPDHSLVFYLSFFQDSTGKSYTPAETLPVLSAASSVPIYGAVDYMLGLGIVGGMLKSSYYQGNTAGKLAKKILEGEKASQIPVVMKSPNQYMFDYLQLERWGIRLSKLPESSVIINEPETFYYRNKKLVWTTAVILLGLLGFIILLLFNIKKRVRAQKGLQTILNCASSMLNYSSLDVFRKELGQQLNELFPIQSPLLLFKHGKSGSKEGGFVLTDPVDKSHKITIPQKAEKLIKASVREKRCSVNRKNGVAFLKSNYLPGNLAYLTGKRRLDDLDRDLLEIFSQNVTMSVENIEKLKIEKSLETAKQIQMSMLPRYFDEFSEQHSIDLQAYLLPAKEVGGDLYDFFAVDEDHLCFLVGDVSGKGVPAALFMAMAKSLIRSAAEDNIHPDRIITKANNILCQDNEEAMFVTVFLAIFNLKTNDLFYTSGGHNPPYIIRSNGDIEIIRAKPGLVLGGMEGASYSVEQTRLNSGDGLFIYSDGVTEAMNVSDELYGEPRLEEALEKNGFASASDLIGKVKEDLNGFVDGAPQSDDITMLFVRV